ncbi:MAG TPA: DUF2490 domain-containing protein [Saprospiraceae bacterium]|nr:DUF2490 domain-containing protein [Saprospiraceae bacterium]
MKFVCILSFLCMGAIGIRAQNQPRQQPLGNWIMYFGDNKINKKWGLHTEYQARNYFIPNTLTQTLIRLGANRYLSSSAMITGGYGFIHTIPSSSDEQGFTTVEHRIWEQLILRHRSYNVFIEHRYRIEQRFVKNLTDGRSINDHRIRYRVQALMPLYNFSPYLRHWFLAGYNELFMNLGRELSGQLFDRNRLYFALGYQVDPRFNVQIGYLNQVIALPDALRPDINHNFQMSVVYNMDDFTSLFTTNK